MRWEALFTDLEAQLAAADAADFDAEVRERTRIELAKVRLADRLRAAIGRSVAIASRGIDPVSGQLVRVGADWLLLDGDGGGEVVVPLTTVLWVTGLGAAGSQPPEGAARLGFGHVLRELSRRRMPVVLADVGGGRTSGTIDRVGADFVEVAEHPPDEPRRTVTVRMVRVVPFDAISRVTSA